MKTYANLTSLIDFWSSLTSWWLFPRHLLLPSRENSLTTLQLFFVIPIWTFRLFNYWLFRGDFDYVVKQAWDGFNGGGSVDRYLFGKLIFQRFYKSIETYGVRKENKEFIDLKNN